MLTEQAKEHPCLQKHSSSKVFYGKEIKKKEVYGLCPMKLPVSYLDIKKALSNLAFCVCPCASAEPSTK